jgi:hypothetical protein
MDAQHRSALQAVLVRELPVTSSRAGDGRNTQHGWRPSTEQVTCRLAHSHGPAVAPRDGGMIDVGLTAQALCHRPLTDRGVQGHAYTVQ